MYLADIITSLANGESGLSSQFAQAKNLWARLVNGVDFTNKMELEQLAIEIGNTQYEFEEIGGSDRDRGKALMGLTCYLPFYDETDGIQGADAFRARALFKAIQASNASGEVIAQAEQAAKFFFLDLDE